MRARRRKEIKTWRIVATFREYYGPPEDEKERTRSHEFITRASTLPDAFMIYKRRFYLDGMIGIGITEVKSHEEKPEREGTGAALS